VTNTPDTPDLGLHTRLEELGPTWKKSLLQNTRCPFLRAVASAGDLKIEDGQNLQSKPVLVATVDSVKIAGNGLANVLAFFARFNHTRGLLPGAETPVGRFAQSKFNLDQSTNDNISDGTHDGSVDIIRGATGVFNPAVVEEIRKIAGNSPVLTPEAMARVIVASNQALFSGVSGNREGKVIDLAKSAGEWGLMFCLLQDDKGDVPIDDLEALCRDARVPHQGKGNLDKSGTREWIYYTAVITAHIVHGQHCDDVKTETVEAMCSVWGEKNNGPGCGCEKCTKEKPGFWDNAGPSIQRSITTFGNELKGWFNFR
jgi:hypothetical protein